MSEYQNYKPISLNADEEKVLYRAQQHIDDLSKRYQLDPIRVLATEHNHTGISFMPINEIHISRENLHLPENQLNFTLSHEFGHFYVNNLWKNCLVKPNQLLEEKMADLFACRVLKTAKGGIELFTQVKAKNIQIEKERRAKFKKLFDALDVDSKSLINDVIYLRDGDTVHEYPYRSIADATGETIGDTDHPPLSERIAFLKEWEGIAKK